MDFKIEGLDTIDKMVQGFKELPLHLTEVVYINALKKAADPLLKRIDLNAPEDTGLMATDLQIAKTKFKKVGEHQVTAGYKKRKGGHGYIAKFHEYGTEKMPAKPFMRPADESTKVQQEGIFTDEIQKQLDKQLNGL